MCARAALLLGVVSLLCGLGLWLALRPRGRGVLRRAHADGIALVERLRQAGAALWAGGSAGGGGWILCALVGAGLLVRALHADLPLRGDEGMIFYELAHRPAYVIAAYYENVGNHVFHTLLTHGFWLIFGDARWTVRLPVVLAGTLLIPLGALAVRALDRGRAAALLTAALLSSSSALIEYSVNGRGYMIQAVLCTIHFGLAAYLAGRDDRAAWLGYGASLTLGLWTLPTTVLVQAGLLLWLLCEALLRGRLRAVLGPALLTHGLAVLAAAILYAPIWIVSGAGHMATMARKPPTLSSAAQALSFVLSLWQIWTRNLPAPLPAVLLCGLCASLVPRRAASDGLRLSPLPFLLAVVLLAGSRLYLVPRLLLPHVVFVYLGCAAGLARIARGLAAIWRQPEAPQRRWSSARLAGSLAAAILAAAGLLAEARHGYVRRSEIDAFPESAAVAVLVRDSAQGAPPAVHAPGPLFYPLLHELRALGVPMVPATVPGEREPAMVMAPGDTLGKSGTLRQPRRAFAVVRRGVAIERSLRHYGLVGWVPSARLLGRVGAAEVYDVDLSR